MQINWKVRVKNKNFWIVIIPTVLLLVQQVAKIFGYEFDFGELGNNLLSIVDTVFVILALLGIITDPTTQGISDSVLAMTYNEPKKKGE